MRLFLQVEFFALPIIPEFDRRVDEIRSVRCLPTGVESVPQQVILLVRGYELGFVLRFVKPLQDVQENVLVVARELPVRHIVEQPFDVIGGR